MENLPLFIKIIFIITTIVTMWLFYKASNNSKITVILMLSWVVVQSVISISGFYTVLPATPPRFPLLILPPLLLIMGLFSTLKGRQYIDGLNKKTLTILHIVRIPVEIVLFWLSIYKVVPELMTLEGRNFDILSGISAPIIFYIVFYKRILSNSLLLVWNIVCLGLLINIVINAVLSAPFPFQQFAFDQPNIAVLYFPFVWLPCCIVPIVLLSHLATIRQLMTEKKKNANYFNN
ncbi:MAG: hypothetical protein JST20_06615 [Bacteroidetes bacterium]|nr:hypothetical protein [Bacteroidota bacterium]